MRVHRAFLAGTFAEASPHCVVTLRLSPTPLPPAMRYGRAASRLTRRVRPTMIAGCKRATSSS
jgi:hypothetical protein